jgi:hypothetical protein
MSMFFRKKACAGVPAHAIEFNLSFKNSTIKSSLKLKQNSSTQ